MRKTGWAAIALILVAASWGATFVLMKPAIQSQPFYDFLATRFTLAVLVMIAVRPSVLKNINRDVLLKGVPIGALLGFGYVTQTIALELTTAAITGFLTGLYVVATPLLAWVFLRQRVTGKVLVGVVLATIGLALISVNFDNFGIEVGQVWGILCAIFFAAHIVGLGIFSRGLNTYALTVVQLATCGVISWAGAFVDGYQAPETGDVWFAVIFSAVFATAIAFFVQTWAQSHMDASRVAIILTSEVVFAAAIAVAVGQEVLSLQVLIGGVVLICSMLVVEWPTKKTASVES